MRDGFIKVAALTSAVRVADVEFNVESSAAAVLASDARVIVLPELAITSYTCEDLFWQDALLRAAEEGLATFAAKTAEADALVLVGVPVRVASKLYNCAAVLSRGELLGLVPKRNIPTYGEFYEGRRFSAGSEDVTLVNFAGFDEVPFGAEQLFECEDVPGLVVAAGRSARTSGSPTRRAPPPPWRARRSSATSPPRTSSWARRTIAATS